MTTRSTTSRILGAAIALSLGTAATAAAQTPTTGGSTRPDSTQQGTMGGTTGTGTMGGTTTGTAGSMGGSGSMGTTGTMGTMSVQDSANGTSARRSGTSSRAATTRRRASSTTVRKDATGGSMDNMQVRKDLTPAPEPAPAPAPEPMAAPAPAPMPEPMPAPAPAPEPVTTTTTQTTVTTETPSMTKFGNGFYFGVQGGANFPQNNIRNAYQTGFGAGLQLGYDPETSPIGLRVNAMYNRFRGNNSNSLAIRPNNAADAELYSAFADAKLRLPFGRFLGATSGLYVAGGPGVTLIRNFRNFQAQTGTAAGNSVINNTGSNNSTRFALNGGAGLDYGIGNTTLFVEGRYVRVFTQGRDTDYVPVTIGLRFHGR